MAFEDWSLKYEFKSLPAPSHVVALYLEYLIESNCAYSKLSVPSMALMDLQPFIENFEKVRTRHIFYHSSKEHPLFSKFAEFGCKIL